MWRDRRSQGYKDKRVPAISSSSNHNRLKDIKMNLTVLLSFAILLSSRSVVRAEDKCDLLSLATYDFNQFPDGFKAHVTPQRECSLLWMTNRSVRYQI